MNKDNTVEKNEKTLNYAIYIPPPLPTQRDTSVPWYALQLKIMLPIYFLNKNYIWMFLSDSIITIAVLFITKNKFWHPEGHRCPINFLLNKKILLQYVYFQHQSHRTPKLSFHIWIKPLRFERLISPYYHIIY